MKNFFLENRKILIFALFFILFRLTIADWNPIPSGSMRPTLLEGDVVFVNRIAYDLKVPFTDTSIVKLGEPRRGDVVTFSSPTTGIKLIKRIEAVPGDVIAMRNKHLTINGKEYAYKVASIGFEKDHQGGAITVIRAEESDGHHKHAMQWVNGAVGFDDFHPITIPEGQYLMLGDNRDQSVDSRYIGLVKRELLVGQAIGILVSGDLDNYLKPRFSRFGLAL